MIHWLWIPVTLVIGVMIGWFLLSLMTVSGREDERQRKWWDDG